jgi:hypothetical protein
MKLYEFKVTMPSGEIKDYAAKAHNAFTAQNKIAKTFNFLEGWQASVIWSAYRIRTA